MLVLLVTPLSVALGETLRFDDGRRYRAALQFGGACVHLAGVMRPIAGGA